MPNCIVCGSDKNIFKTSSTFCTDKGNTFYVSHDTLHEHTSESNIFICSICWESSVYKDSRLAVLGSMCKHFLDQYYKLCHFHMDTIIEGVRGSQLEDICTYDTKRALVNYRTYLKMLVSHLYDNRLAYTIESLELESSIARAVNKGKFTRILISKMYNVSLVKVREVYDEKNLENPENALNAKQYFRKREFDF